jgi:hypothetical protein
LPHAGSATSAPGALGSRHPRRIAGTAPASTASNEANATKKSSFVPTPTKKKRFIEKHNKKNAPSPTYHHQQQQKKGFSLFATRQPATRQQKKAKMGQSKKRNILCNPLSLQETRQSLGVVRNARQRLLAKRSACSRPLFSRIKRIDSEGVMRDIEMMQYDKGEKSCADAIR